MTHQNPTPPAAPEPQRPLAEVKSFPGSESEHETVLLVGNPNVGKSVLFKNLTNRYVMVSNYPGTTVEIVRATADLEDGKVQVIDSPGVNDLSQRSEDALVTKRLLQAQSTATVIQVADAKNLRRALLLTLQLAELGRPMALVLNMLDELDERGGHIDIEELSAILGIPVVTSVAIRNEGTDSVKAAITSARVPDPAIAVQREGKAYDSNRDRLAQVHEIMAESYSISPPSHPSLRVRLGFWAMHPAKGWLMLALVLLGTFWLVGLLGAGTLVDAMEVGLFQQRVLPGTIELVDVALPFPHEHPVEQVELEVGLPITPVHSLPLFSSTREVIGTSYSLTSEEPLGAFAKGARLVHDFLVGEFGVISMALSYALAIVLPIVTTFFLIFGLLEDSGYLPRLSVMLDRFFRLMGLNGKAVLPMVLGLGCDTMATMTTRILETRRERIVTTMLLALAVPCSAQLGVLLAMMASLSMAAAGIWLLLLAGVILLVGWLTSRLFDEEGSDFILEIPPLRRPQAINVAVKTVSRIDWYLREVIPIFVIGTAVLFLLDQLDLLAGISRLAEPLVSGWLGLPTETANAFLVGFMRRDFGAVYLLAAATGPSPLLTPLQIFTAMVTITLFMPCFANLLMIAKEHGTKLALQMTAFIFPFAFFVGGVVYRIGSWVTQW